MPPLALQLIWDIDVVNKLGKVTAPKPAKTA
jgi:hypothetical protein